MSYIVVYQKADGSSGLEECVDLDLAIVTAERLRNVDAVERPRIFQTEEIRYDFKPYYRVEVATAGGAAADAATDLGTTTNDLGSTVTPLSSVNPIDSEPLEPVVPVAETEAPGANVAEEATASHDIFATNAAEVEELTPPEVPSESSGLFGATEDAVESTEVQSLADDIAENVEVEAPRRGLFGR